MPEYKQVSVTLETKEKIDSIKSVLAKNGTPMQSPAIVGTAINMFAEKVKKA